MGHFKIENLSYTYPNCKEKALDQVNLVIEKGQYITVCGRSGSGKTTLLRHLKSVLTPHGKRTGGVFFEGQPLEEVSLKEQSGKIGYVMQNPDNQIVTDKVWHELAFGLESLGCDQKTMRLRVAEMASYFGIQGWFHKDVAELSGGQKQLLNLASIMAMQPSVIILDEPTSQLDPIAAADFLNTVRKINLELGTTIIITEHRLEDIYYASDRVVVMEKGRIIADDEPRAVGAQLRADGSDMFAAMPSPVQIYYGTESRLPCPLTVREGRTWLSKYLESEIGGEYAEADRILTDARSVDDGQDYEAPDHGILEVQEAWFRYEKDAPDILKGVSFKVRPGELFAIVGGNGTGKSTTLKAICDICRPYRGKILVEGKAVAKYKGQDLFRKRLSMLPQDPQSLFVKKTIREDLEEMLPSGGSKEERETLIRTTAETCEIVELLDKHPYDLSGGEQQRAALAKVLMTSPRILLLDEPTKGIDAFFKLKFAKILKRLQEQGVTIVMVSHDIEFCARYADAVSMFFDGSIMTTNTPNRFFSRNSFYTTAANRMSRHVFENAVTNEDVIRLIREEQGNNYGTDSNK